MATRTLEDGTQETATLFPDGSVGIIHTDPKTGRTTHFDAARPLRRGMPKAKVSYLDLAVGLTIALLIAAGTIAAAYCR